MFKLRYLFVVLFFIAAQVKAQSFEFTENKGQWDEHVKFKGELSTGAFFLLGNGYRVLQHDTASYFRALELLSGHSQMPSANDAARKVSPQAAAGLSSPKEIVVKSHAYDVLFAGANPKAVVTREREMPGYANYFLGNDSSKWASNVKTYGALVYKGIYPGIDVRYYSENGYVKYDLILQPNASPEAITLQYDGVESLTLDNGDLVIKTSVNTVREQFPLSYQLVNGIRQQVKCRYEISGNKVHFKLSGYDRSKVLVIDPTLIFSSFTGSQSDNWGYTATYDKAGNLYAGGIVFGSGYPVTTGAFQAIWGGGGNTGENGGFDIGLMKFNSSGSQRIYATYLGGNGNEQPHSLVVDNNGDLIMAGRSTSANYPTTRTAMGTGGGWDIIISRLSASGTTMIGSVRIGGGADDGVNIKHKYGSTGSGPQSLMRNYGDDARSEVVLDGSGNILVASCTQSTDFPVTAGVFQRVKSGLQDGLVLKFNANLSTQIFTTHIGGTQDDAAYVIAIGSNGDIYTGGGTSSSDFPGNKAGTVGPNFNNGICDGFIAVLSNDGATLKKTTYIGTLGADQVYGIQFDRAGFFYLQGTSTGNFPVQNAAFSQPGGKQFIAKLQPDLSAFVYSTVWGSAGSNVPNISPIAFLVDRCENVYISGWGGTVIETNPSYAVSGTTGLTTTPDAIKSVTDGRDFYFFVLEKDAQSQLFGSFFGQQDASKISDHVDGGTSRFDQDGIIYQALCANCQGGQYPTTPGVVSPSNPSGRCNEAVVKIAFDLSGVRGGVKAAINNVDGDTTGCVPVTVQFRDTVLLAKSYEWFFADGSPTEVTNTPDIGHTFNAVGNYRVRMIAVDSAKCYPRDTTYVNIIVRADKATVLAAATKLPPCESNTYRFDNLTAAPAGKPFQNNSFTWIFGDNTPDVVAGTAPVVHQFPGAGTYNVKLVLTDTNYCNAPDTFPLTLRVSPNVVARYETPPSGCAPYQATFNNTSLGGASFTWFFGDGTTSTETSPTKLYATPGTYTVKLVAVDNNTCNLIDSTSSTITVSGKPTAGFSFSPNPPEENRITTFLNLSENANRYLWIFGDGATLETIRLDTIVKHQYKKTDTYSACLVAINEFGCPDTFCLPIPIIINPLLDVVSAFTPNQDGVNDKAVVIGYGIEKMTFRVYNRWGQVVYESADPDQGWDGRFKGKNQPMDAYGYTLDAIMFGGNRIKKSGSITLVR
ncbi:MAG: PKD domain-containing protein [Bacteroidota bacterium]